MLEELSIRDRNKSNIEGDKEFINELLDGLDYEQMKEVKKLAFRLMTEQNVHENVLKPVYDNAYKYIAVRRLYRKEIEAYTNKSILGDYKSTETGRWVILPKGD